MALTYEQWLRQFAQDSPDYYGVMLDDYTSYLENQLGMSLHSASGSMGEQWWSPSEDSNEYWEAITKYGNLRWGSPQENTGHKFVWSTNEGWQLLEYRDGSIIWITAPDQAVLNILELKSTLSSH